MKVLRAYGWVFLASGALFVADSDAVAVLLDAAGRLLEGAPSSAAEPTYWLVLTGSMMAMIAALSWRLADDPGDETAWQTLLLSKAVSTALFLVFAAARREALFLLGAAVDGAILAHLALLRARLECDDPYTARLPRAHGPRHEAWFTRVNDEDGWAAWTRVTLRRGPAGDEAALWAVLFPPDGPALTAVRRVPLARVRFGDEGRIVELDGGGLSRSRMNGSLGEDHFDLTWETGPTPPYRLVPRWLAWTGLAGSQYLSAAPQARVSGTVRVGGRERAFHSAPGCVGHVWGTRLGRGWWWAHAASGGEVIELLCAPAALGLRLTVAAFSRRGRTMLSLSPLALLSNSSRLDSGSWRFCARLDDGVLEGECRADGPRAAVLDYEGPRGERLRCRNAKTGDLTADSPGSVFACAGHAAVEFAEPP